MDNQYTSLEQSKELQKRLPENSSDLWWNQGSDIPSFRKETEKDIPCWSLGALIEQLPRIYGRKPTIDLEDNLISYGDITGTYSYGKTLIDACINLIKQLS